MKWEQMGCSTVAKGFKGAFLINKSKIYYYSKYITKNQVIDLPRSNQLYIAKAICEKSKFWEK